MAEFGARYVRHTDDSDEERTFFNIKHVPKYGTSNSGAKSLPSETYEYFVRHPIKEGDTLNSIALNYGLKTSVIKQANRLWDDSIFLFNSLLVPISSPENVPAGCKGEVLSRSEAMKVLPKPRRVGVKEMKSPNGGHLPTSNLLVEDAPSNDGKIEVEASLPASTDDYFSKFDSSILRIKSNLERIEKESRSTRLQATSKPPTLTEQKQHKKSGARSKVAKNPLSEPAMKFYRNPDGSSEAKIQERFEKLENEIFQL